MADAIGVGRKRLVGNGDMVTTLVRKVDGNAGTGRGSVVVVASAVVVLGTTGVVDKVVEGPEADRLMDTAVVGANEGTGVKISGVVVATAVDSVVGTGVVTVAEGAALAPAPC